MDENYLNDLMARRAILELHSIAIKIGKLGLKYENPEAMQWYGEVVKLISEEIEKLKEERVRM